MRRDAAGDWRLVELDLDAPRPASAAPMIVGDIAPYRSMRTGERIAGRAQHRAHLKRWGLEEVGNERAAFQLGESTLSPPTTAPRPPSSAPLGGPAKGEIAAEVKRQLARDPGERRAEAEGALRAAGYDGPQIDRILKG